MEFSHFDKNGQAIMVDVGAKPFTDRIAIACGKIYMSAECFEKIKQSEIKKGDVLGVARIAGIMGAKKCRDLIPLCHSIPLTKMTIDFKLNDDKKYIEAIATAKTNGQTGVEMEALTGVQIALLTIYDMCKAVDKSMCITDVCLLEKDGGKSGHFVNEAYNDR